MVENMIENLYLLIEITTILLILWALHGSRKQPGIYTIAYVCISLVIENAISLNLIPAFFIIFIHFGIVFLNVLEFKDSIKNAILFGFIDVLTLFIIQFLFGMLYIVVCKIFIFDRVKVLLLQIFFLIIVICLCWKKDFQIICKIFIENGIIGSILLVILGIISIIYIFRLHVWGNLEWKSIVFLIIFFIAVLTLLYEWQRENFINKQKSAELELFQQYNSIYQDFILDMRKKQHDFDNHLQAIFSMNMTAQNMNSLIEQQNNYCRQLSENNQDSIFLKEDVNSVYLAFLYTKKKTAEQLGIDVKYRFDCHDIEAHLSFMDFTVIFGNLFDNATEAVIKEKYKIIILEIFQNENSILIHVFNTYSFSAGEMPIDFLKRKSKKGEDHGFGLSNINDIVKQYHGIIQSTFDYINENKFYKLSLQLFWKKE